MKIIIIFLLFSGQAFAKRELLARASDRDGFPARSLCFFTNQSPVAFPGAWLLRYLCLDDGESAQELWLSSPGGSRLLHAVGEGRQLSDPIVSGDVVYLVESDDQRARVLWEIAGGEKRAHSWEETHWRIHGGVALGEGRLLLRASDASGELRELSWQTSGVRALDERGVSYPFAAAASDELVVQKNRLGLSRQWDESRPDVIEVRRAPEFEPRVVLVDRDADPSSPYLGFWNFSLAQGSQWCVIARRAEGEVAVIGDGEQVRELPLYRYFERLDFFAPALTAAGVLVVRAVREGRYALWALYPSGAIVELLGIGDPLVSDRGPAQVRGPLFVTPVVAQGQSVSVGVTLGELGTATPLGQGVLEIFVPAE